MKFFDIPLWPGREDVRLWAVLNEGMALPGRAPEPLKAPALIICPGGGYRHCGVGGPEGMTTALEFAAEGYQCFVLGYRTEESAPDGLCAWPGPLYDLGRAFQELHRNARDWGLDPRRISVLGYSAGGHLAGMYASSWRDAELLRELGAGEEELRPRSVLCLYGVLDYRVQKAQIEREPMPMNEGEIKRVFGEDAPSEERLRQLSPACLVNADTPPMFLSNCADDHSVPAVQSLLMAQKLLENGVYCEYHLFPEGGHAYGPGRDRREPWRPELQKPCAAWLPMAKRFLARVNETEERGAGK